MTEATRLSELPTHGTLEASPLRTRFFPLLRAFAAALSPAENPHLQKAIRAESRKRRPLVAVLGTIVALVGTGALTWLIWWKTTADPRTLGWLVARDWSVLRVAMMACTGVHAFIILIVVANRTQRYFIKEATQNTLEQLLLTPTPPSELLLHITIHNFYYGMLLALAGLPLYFLWVAMGDLTWWQLFALYALFARISFSTPSPQGFVAMWRMRQQRGQKKAQQTPAERKRARRQAVPAMVGVITSIGIQLFMQVGMRVIGRRYGAQLAAAAQKLWQLLPASVQGLLPSVMFSWLYCWVLIVTAPLPWYRFHLAPLIFMIPFMMVGRALWILSGAEFIKRNVPLMTAPAGGSAPAGGAHAVAATVAPSLTMASRTEASGERALSPLEAVSSFVFGVAFLGYFWQPLIANGGLSWLVSTTASDARYALAGLTLWYLGGGIHATIGFLRGQLTSRVLRKPSTDEEAPHVVASPLGKLLATPLVRTALTLALACALGGVWPLHRPSLIVIGKLIALGLATGAFCLAARWWQARVLAIRPPDEDDVSDVILQVTNPQASRVYKSRIWYFNSAWRVSWLLWLLVWIYPLAALLVQHPLVNFTAAVSPLMSYSALTPRVDEMLQGTGYGFAHVPPWWAGLFLQPFAALVFGALALRLASRKSVVIEETDGWWWRQYERLRAWNERLVARLGDWLSARYDNPVAMKDLRARARRENWAVRDLAIVVLVGMLMLGVVAFLIWGTQFSGRPASTFLLTTLLTGLCPELGQMPVTAQILLSVLLPLWALEWIITGLAAASAGTAFDGERDSSTLGFLLITPLRNREIMLGKWLGFSLDSWISALSVKPLFAVLVLGAALSGAPQTLPLFVAVTMFNLALLFAVSALAVTFSARTRARTAGTAWAVLFVLVSQPVAAVFMFGFFGWSTLLGYVIPLTLLAVAHALLGAFAQWWGARVIGKMRVRDVAFEGQKREN